MSRRDSDTFGNLVCSFCGKSQREIKKLIAGPTVHICDECIELCNDIIREEAQKEDIKTGTTKVPTAVFSALEAAGVDLNDVFTLLEAEGVDTFVAAWQELLDSVATEQARHRPRT